MKILTLLFALGICLAANASAKTLATFDGVGKVRIGMTPKQVERALGKKFAPMDHTDGSNEVCWQAHLKNENDSGTFYMFESGHLTRIYVGAPENGPAPDVETPSGIRIGSSLADVRAAYAGKATEKPNFYDYPSPNVMVNAPDHKHAILFYVPDNAVKEISVGIHPAIDAVEGCL